MRRSASVPSLPVQPDFTSHIKLLEVYVVLRPFIEWGGDVFHSLPASFKQALQDLGVAHFLVAVRTPDGKLFRFDFGPAGGRDIVLPSSSRKKKCVPGEVREGKLAELPSSHMYVGKTTWSLQDIRSFNQLQQDNYQLNTNDCRHYVNNLVRQTTGVPGATTRLIRHHFQLQRQHCMRWNDRILAFGHHFTDVNNWPRILAAGKATLGLAILVSGRRAVPRLLPRARPAASKLLPAARARLASTRITKRPVYGFSAAAASYAAAINEVPLFREALILGTRISQGMYVAAYTAALAAANMTGSSLRSTQSLAGNAAAAAGAAAIAATRGAADRLHNQKQLAPVVARPTLAHPSPGLHPRRFQLPRLRRRPRNPAVFASVAL
ncbi:hypothetical protein WJX74_005440 [Apatococcus lobatus]|uniref:LRAT domain-containing protein n=1 Tax=Apatococcus lobatus TaxID=904363 RepID=A0AAW1PV53_9CHLO